MDVEQLRIDRSTSPLSFREVHNLAQGQGDPIDYCI
jgi:hypothetical protein